MQIELFGFVIKWQQCALNALEMISTTWNIVILRSKLTFGLSNA